MDGIYPRPSRTARGFLERLAFFAAAFWHGSELFDVDGLVFVSTTLPVGRQILRFSTAMAARSGHRDLKPANVLISEPGAPERPPQVKLVDFGLSTLAAREDKAESSEQGPDPSAVMAAPAGTPMYMAPESTERRYSAQLAADIFSFGVMAFELLTRELPFQSPPALVPPEALAEVPLLQKLCPGLPPPLVAVLQRCLLPDPNRRPTAEALATALTGF